MKFLADECFDERLAVLLRAAGHDVTRVPAGSGLTDLGVAEEAERGDRLLLTHDTDFGAVAVHGGRPSTGVILVRVAVVDPEALGVRLVRLVEGSGQQLFGGITVVGNLATRFRSFG